MRRNLSPAWAVGTFVACLAVGGCLASENPHDQTPVPVTTCEEDEPCWDCTTMGNMICGPSAPDTGNGAVLIPPVTLSAEG